ncbi:P-loop containing nucleoside triphosphate hydrolase protein [Kickxella alabastrina]|uniref:P-loop containing nucleoside triphosphate hydrolase protein n=1 Tax=Kickxella alabastrina TaxID=61397 RepID=UPI00221EDC7B|nr:P-loop containing nucleoside triphosphate hydrolase protein [Kickxella alabastrina]KAI7831041.1 P-loop containing nucleoside triphosphate hydrolase protein [Kickxella alabastrina]
MNGCYFAWRTKNMLADIPLKVNDTKLVAVVGKTGSGKSLLLSMCSEAEMTQGSGQMVGTISYLEQSPWIMNNTMGANIIFGRTFDEQLYWGLFTRATKSTLVTVHKPEVELYNSGLIVINGQDIAAIGVGDLRPALGIIPQESIMFSGTFAENLNPPMEFTKKNMWLALEKLGGGQKQLFSLCRMLMRRRKILVLDEATANLIKKDFGDCIVLIIAHRLEIMMNSDHIIVMEGGEIVETGAPQALLKGRLFADVVRTSDFDE